MKDNSNVVICLTFPVKWQVVFAIQSKNLLVSNFFCNKPSKQVSAKHVNKHTLPKSYAYQVSESTPTLVIVDVGLSPFCYMLPFMLLHYIHLTGTEGDAFRNHGEGGGPRKGLGVC